VSGSPETRTEVAVVDDPSARRFEARVGDQMAGFSEYRLKPGQIVFTHTEVDPAFEGQGVGSRLAAGVLDAARQRGLAVIPLCPFIRAYIKRHPQYADLVAAGAGGSHPVS
jgi:predicted GNAT family acetyltransferase